MDGDAKLLNGCVGEQALEILCRGEGFSSDVTRGKVEGDRVRGKGIRTQLKVPVAERCNLNFSVGAVGSKKWVEESCGEGEVHTAQEGQIICCLKQAEVVENRFIARIRCGERRV